MNDYWRALFDQANNDDELLVLIRGAGRELIGLNPDHPKEALRYAHEIATAIKEVLDE